MDKAHSKFQILLNALSIDDAKNYTNGRKEIDALSSLIVIGLGEFYIDRSK